MWTFILCLSSLVVYAVAQTADQKAALDTSNAKVRQEILDAINDCRRNVSPSPSNMLKAIWSPEAAQNAQKYAEKCRFDHSEQSERNIPNFQCGENIYKSSGVPNWKGAIGEFCKEQKDFTYGKGKNTPGAKTEHFTQMAQYNSYLVGCGYAKCPTEYIMVCHHCPHGVMMDNKPYNSGNACGECPNNCDTGLCTNSCDKGNDVTNCNAYRGRCDNPSVQQACGGMCKCPNAIV